MSTEAEKIAAGLSEEAKNALLMFGESSLPGNMLEIEPGDEAVVDELLRACCVGHIRAAGHQFLDEQPFGLEVREILRRPGLTETMEARRG